MQQHRDTKRQKKKKGSIQFHSQKTRHEHWKSFSHAKAGDELKNKCRKFPVKAHVDGDEVRCFPRECKITDTEGTKLTNCKYVFHTVGPDCRKASNMSYNANILRSCYENCLQSMLNPDISIRSLALCCISTGIFAYPNEDAAKLAWETVVLWLEKNHGLVDKIIFCTYLSKDYDIYLKLLSKKNSKNDNLNLLDLQESRSNNNSSDLEKVSYQMGNDDTNHEHDDDNDEMNSRKESGGGAKYNFSKKRSNITDKKKLAQDKKRKSELRDTPEGRNKYNDSQRQRMSASRADPKVRDNYNDSQKERMSTSRADPKVREKHNESERERLSA